MLQERAPALDVGVEVCKGQLTSQIEQFKFLEIWIVNASRSRSDFLACVENLEIEFSQRKTLTLVERNHVPLSLNICPSPSREDHHLSLSSQSEDLRVIGPFSGCIKNNSNYFIAKIAKEWNGRCKSPDRSNCPEKESVRFDG
jgi:hypothetical protein